MHRQALRLLERLLEPALEDERRGSAIQILALLSLIHHSQGNTALAIDGLERALTLAEPEGFVRTFVDEGEPMRRLLRAAQLALSRRLSDRVDEGLLRILIYTDKLLAAFSPMSSEREMQLHPLEELLSARELDILRLINAGRSNKEIAGILMIAVSTVKSHINNLYGKLGANRRTEAIAIAREKGLLAD